MQLISAEFCSEVFLLRFQSLDFPGNLWGKSDLQNTISTWKHHIVKFYYQLFPVTPSGYEPTSTSLNLRDMFDYFPSVSGTWREDQSLEMAISHHFSVFRIDRLCFSVQLGNLFDWMNKILSWFIIRFK